MIDVGLESKMIIVRDRLSTINAPLLNRSECLGFLFSSLLFKSFHGKGVEWFCTAAIKNRIPHIVLQNRHEAAISEISEQCVILLNQTTY